MFRSLLHQRLAALIEHMVPQYCVKPSDWLTFDLSTLRKVCPCRNKGMTVALLHSKTPLASALGRANNPLSPHYDQIGLHRC